MGDLWACEWEDAAAAQSRVIIKLEIRHVVCERVLRVLQTRARELSRGVGNTETTGKRLRQRGCTCLSFTRRKGCEHEDRICEEVDETMYGEDQEVIMRENAISMVQIAGIDFNSSNAQDVSDDLSLTMTKVFGPSNSCRAEAPIRGVPDAQSSHGHCVLRFDPSDFVMLISLPWHSVPLSTTPHISTFMYLFLYLLLVLCT